MEKLPIGPCAGSCGTAAYRGSPVIVSDIATDPLWDVPEHRAAALSHGLRASWSNPILSSEGKVLGTFCIYERIREARTARPGVIEKATYLARIAIERDQAETGLRTSEQKYRDLLTLRRTRSASSMPTANVFWLIRQVSSWQVVTEDELIGSSIADTYLPEDRHLLENRHREIESRRIFAIRAKIRAREMVRSFRWRFLYRRCVVGITRRSSETLASVSDAKPFWLERTGFLRW